MRRLTERIYGRLSSHVGKHSPLVVSRGLDAAAWMAPPRWLYIFSPVARNQMWPQRGQAMRRVLGETFDGPIQMLEIGTWFGEGSTPVWLEVLPSGSHLVLLDGWRPYVSIQDRKDGPRHYASMDLVPFAAWHNVARRVFKYERRSNRVGITVIRGNSGRTLSMLSASSFDVVFVDGSHYYEDVKRDLIEALRISRNSFALICGDDLECKETPDLIELSRMAPMRDTIETSYGTIHPGVLLAVHEVLGRVNSDSGFWWTYVVNGEVTPDFVPRQGP